MAIAQPSFGLHFFTLRTNGSTLHFALLDREQNSMLMQAIAQDLLIPVVSNCKFAPSKVQLIANNFRQFASAFTCQAHSKLLCSTVYAYTALCIRPLTIIRVPIRSDHGCSTMECNNLPPDQVDQT